MTNGEEDLKKPTRTVCNNININILKTEAIESLEREFKNVVSTLNGDEKLVPFLVEYEKLFRALKKSLQHEKYLTKKCEELTKEITNNASKIQKALQLSQQDQNTIAWLKQDSEKAWSLVEAGKKKDHTITQTIDRLQDEVNKLSSELQEGRAHASGQEEELNNISLERDHLKARQRQLLHQENTAEKAKSGLEYQIEQQEAKIEELHKTNKKMTGEINESNRELIAAKEKYERSNLEASDLKSKLEIKVKDCINLQYSTSLASNKSEQLNKDLQVANKKMEKQAVESEELSRQTQQLSENLEAQKNAMIAVNLDLEKNRESLKLTIAAQNRLASEKAQLQRKYDNEHRNVLRLQQAAEDDRNVAQRSQKDIQVLQEELDKSNRRDDQNCRQLHVLEREKNLQMIKIQRTEQKAKRADDDILHYGQTIATLEKDSSSARDTIENLNKKLNSLEKMIEKNSNDLSQERAETENVRSVVRLRDIEIQEMKKNMCEWEAKAHDQLQTCNKLRGERGKLSRQLVGSKEDITKLKDQVRVFSNEVRSLRQELSCKDECLVQEHFDTKQEKMQNEKKSGELSRVKRHINEQEDIIQKQRQELRRMNASIKQLDEDALQQRKDYDKVINERDILGAQLIRRNDELALMHERIKIQRSTLSKGEMQYKERLADMRSLTTKLQDAQRELSARKGCAVSDDRNFSVELAQKDRELLQEKVKVKALSDELENPMNVHRWRKLEGSDPATFELVQKIDILQKRLIKKTEQVAEKDAIIQEQHKQMSMLQKKIARHPNGEIVEKLSVKETKVREKERQMKAMAGELNMNQTQVNEYRKEIEQLNSELQELKQKFYELKKKEALFKERELQWLAESSLMSFEQLCQEVDGGHGMGTYTCLEHEANENATHRRRPMHKPIRFVGGGFRATPHES